MNERPINVLESLLVMLNGMSEDTTRLDHNIGAITGIVAGVVKQLTALERVCANGATDREKTSSREWVSIAQAEKILGIPRTEINGCIEHAKLPFHQNGKRRIVNIKLIRAYFCRMDIENMKRTAQALAAQPFSQQKVTGNIGNHGRRQPRVRRVEI